MPPILYILSGPNGAGKTTASKALLPMVFNTAIFINADIIAANLHPANPESVAIQAGRIMIAQVREAMAASNTFALETTLATRSYLQLINKPNCKAMRWYCIFSICLRRKWLKNG